MKRPSIDELETLFTVQDMPSAKARATVLAGWRDEYEAELLNAGITGIGFKVHVWVSMLETAYIRNAALNEVARKLPEGEARDTVLAMRMELPL